MDWFESLTGFKEIDYAGTRAKLAVQGRRLRSLVNGMEYGIGELELVSLATLRERAKAAGGLPGRQSVTIITGDVRQMHHWPENAGALFQVASQFNLLEMTSQDVTPEDGVTRYQYDATQGPACAIAAGAATIYRNYFAEVGQDFGQTTARQLDGLADVGVSLSKALNRPVSSLWAMRNGYALCSLQGLQAISKYLGDLTEEQLDSLRGNLRIGFHRDVEVTDCDQEPRPVVSQAFCSALPVAYSPIPPRYWEPFARLVLEAAYEATMWAAVINSQRGASNAVLLTTLGGRAFGNEEAWIHESITRALRIFRETHLNAKIVSRRGPSAALSRIAHEIY